VTTLGERLRTLRVAAGLSQAELAGDDLSASYISLLEAGKRTPSNDVVRQLAERLSCSISQLVAGRPSEYEDRIALDLAFARLALEHGEAAEARRRLENLLDEEGLSPRLRDEVSYRLAVACSRMDDLITAVRVALPLYEQSCLGHTHLPVHTLGLHLCYCYREAGDLARAVEVGETALSTARAQGLASTDEYYRLAATVMGAYMERGDRAHARIWAEQLLADALTESRSQGQAALYWNLGVLAAEDGRISEALHLYEQALGRLSELDSTRDFARLRVAVAMSLLRDDPPQVARTVDILNRCENDVKDLCSPDDLSHWHWAMAVALMHDGDLTSAEEHARQALDRASAQAEPRVDALRCLGDLSLAGGRDDEAFGFYRAALTVMRGAPRNRSMALQWRELAERLADDDPALAAEAFRQALDVACIPDRSIPQRRQVMAFRADLSFPADSR
jgi:transcriptional regulator with XRE-family HTH domain